MSSAKNAAVLAHLNDEEEEVGFISERTNTDSDLNLENILKETPLTEDTTCGYGFFDHNFLQRFANIKSFVVLFGIVGSIFSMTNSYFNGILTTVEKRFKIPSKNIGIIMVGLDCTNLFASWLISYYGGRAHRPRWLGLGLISIMLYCILTSSPHFIYGPGTDALQLTKEYNDQRNVSVSRASNTVLCNFDGKLAFESYLFILTCAIQLLDKNVLISKQHEDLGVEAQVRESKRTRKSFHTYYPTSI